ncbi:MAG: rhodanese-like domain-containing protein [Candidatus Lernaella stagnicola]|nr:rhodanese-like domain-containing protein [Candidatus Lernaella stagnicola]
MTYRSAVFTLIAASLLLTPSFGSATGSDGEAYIDENTVVDWLENDTVPRNVVLLDVRTPTEFAAGHLPDAVNINLLSMEFPDRIDQLDRDKRYVLYCRTQNRSGFAYRLMKKMGFENIRILQTGYATWFAKGWPTTQ